MKIVHICLVGPVTDGFSYQDNMLSKYHKVMGCDVDFIASEWIWGSDGEIVKDERQSYINENGVRMYRLPLIGKDSFAKKIKIYSGLLHTLNNCRPDIIFLHGPQFLQVKTIKSYMKKHPAVQLYVDNHADFSNSGTNWLSKNILHKILWRHMAQLIEPYTTKFYGVLPARVDWLVNMYRLPKDKCDLLVMGADDEMVADSKKTDVKETLRAKYGIARDDFLIVTGGKIDPWKKQTLLLMEAIAKIDNPKVKLIVFGSVTKDLQERVNEHCVENKVLYIGWVRSDDSYKYFAAADLVVFPGRHSVFWEQVAGLGIPMLCKYWEGTAHVDLGGNVRFLYKDSVDEIYSQIKEIASNRHMYNEMKSVAENQGMKIFSYREIAKRSIDLDGGGK